MAIDERGAQSPPMPWLLYTCGDGSLNKTVCVKNSSASCICHSKIECEIPESQGKQIWACFHGWLLLYDEGAELEGSLFLWDPVTSESIKLPPLPFLPQPETTPNSILTSSPKEPECTILLFDKDNHFITYCKLGDYEWTKHEYGEKLVELFGDEFHGQRFHELACVDSVIYTYALYTCPMVSIEVDKQNCLHIKSVGLLMPASSQFCRYPQSYLLESSGELYYVELNFLRYDCIDYNEIVGIEIFKLDFSHMIWLKVDSLKDRLFFLGKSSSTSCAVNAQSGINEEDKIFLCVDKLLHTYDVECRRILVSLPCPSLLQTQLSKAAWVMPNFCSTEDIQARAHPRVVEEESKSPDYVESPQRDVFVKDDEHMFLPLDMLTEVARRLMLPDYLHFRTTCSLLRLAAPAPNAWRSTQLLLEMQFPYPLLVTYTHDKNIVSFTDPKHHETYFMNLPESSQGKSMCGCKDGYLLLAHEKDRFLYNPFTRNQRQLPTSSHYCTGITFSSSPSSSDFMVVEIYAYLGDVDISVVYPGEAEWSYIYEEVGDGDVEIITNLTAPVVYQGSFYIFSQKGTLAVLSVVGDDYDWEVLTDVKAPCDDFLYNYLVECNGELMSVFVDSEGEWVKVFKLDSREMSWVRVTSLGSEMIFVSHTSCVSALARISGMENKIYFPRFFDGGIVYYSLETGKFHTHGSDKAIDNFRNVSQQLYCGWIEFKQ